MAEHYYLGLPMWSNRDWIGSLYPAGANSKNFLHYYSSVFNTVEGNTSFYSLPSEASVQSWKEQAVAGFRFSFKLPRRITHELALLHAREELTAFFHRLEPLADNLGVFMIQLPSRFGAEQLTDLSRFIDSLPGEYHYAVEVRHKIFFDRGDEEKALNQLLHNHQINRVCFDSRSLFSRPATNEAEKHAQGKKPRLPVHAISTADSPLIRFIGCSDPEHNQQYLLPWIKKINQWKAEGKTPYMFIHTPDNHLAPQQAEQFNRLLGGQPLSKSLLDGAGADSQLAIF